MVISVELSSNRVIAAPNDEVYLRQGDETVKLSYEQRTQLSYDKGQRFFEDEVVADATLEDIDDSLVQDFKNRFDISDRSTEEILKARRFLVNGKLTKAAILLLVNTRQPSSLKLVFVFSGLMARTWGQGLALMSSRKQPLMMLYQA